MGKDLVMPLGRKGLASNPQYSVSGSVLHLDTYKILVKVTSTFVAVAVVLTSKVMTLLVVSIAVTLVFGTMPMPDTRCATARPTVLETVMVLTPAVMLAT